MKWKSFCSCLQGGETNIKQVYNKSINFGKRVEEEEGAEQTMTQSDVKQELL